MSYLVILKQTIENLEKLPIGVFNGDLEEARKWCSDMDILDKESYFVLEVPGISLAETHPYVIYDPFVASESEIVESFKTKEDADEALEQKLQEDSDGYTGCYVTERKNL